MYESRAGGVHLISGIAGRRCNAPDPRAAPPAFATADDYSTAMMPEVIACQILCSIVSLAQATTLPGAPSPEQTAKAWGMIALVAMAGLLMLILLVGLIVMRRTYRARLSRSSRQAPPAASVDAWTESGKRMKVDAEEE